MRKTQCGNIPKAVLENASKAVSQGMAVRKATTTREINRISLKRFIEKQKSGEIYNGMLNGYTATADAHRVLTDQMEIDLSNQIKNLSNVFHRISSKKVRELGYELAKSNKMTIPESWQREEKAGQHLLLSPVIHYIT